MGTEQLVGTIEQVEQHNTDPTQEDPWTEATARWSDINEGLRRRYRDLVGEDGPDEEAVRDAIRTLGEAAQSVIASIGTAMKDPEVRAQVKDAAASLVSALGTTFDELGDELRRSFAEEQAAEADQSNTSTPG
jgi:hypothetical protein